jgi:hypothetical protein
VVVVVGGAEVVGAIVVEEVDDEADRGADVAPASRSRAAGSSAQATTSSASAAATAAQRALVGLVIREIYGASPRSA